MKTDFRTQESWSPEHWLHPQLCWGMRKIKAALKQVKPISTANSKAMVNDLFIPVSPVFPSIQIAADSLLDNLVVFLNDSLVRFFIFSPKTQIACAFNN